VQPRIAVLTTKNAKKILIRRIFFAALPLIGAGFVSFAVSLVGEESEPGRGVSRILPS
jgi:hypothetical protein